MTFHFVEEKKYEALFPTCLYSMLTVNYIKKIIASFFFFCSTLR